MQWVGVKAKGPYAWGTPVFYGATSKFAQSLPLRETLFLLYWTATKLALCSWRETLSLSSKAILYSSILCLTRIAWNESRQCLCL